MESKKPSRQQPQAQTPATDELMGEASQAQPQAQPPATDELMGEASQAQPQAQPPATDELMGEASQAQPPSQPPATDELMGEASQAQPPSQPPATDELMGEASQAQQLKQQQAGRPSLPAHTPPAVSSRIQCTLARGLPSQRRVPTSLARAAVQAPNRRPLIQAQPPPPLQFIPSPNHQDARRNRLRVSS
ncbi:hypothetical protein Micbo1qcDRAFT_181194 [Microdochium bolleyi]|uniref:Uncharacterized protein n=1 Tax=Microdochium bolleyi TaxID=196109 RepID=A0A136IJ61_9PEZI|nr:hypothetical protein Micbo1qcDRAFT_181194 [Microdochium bolleyi]